MSEYWVSHKRYHCKYCNIYIADDKPSRTQHENGLRHKGNVERFVRGLYKEGEKRVREKEEEKGIMAGVAKAAGAAYALDIASGRALTSSSSSLASSSRSVPPLPAQHPQPAKPTNPYASYTTAAHLGYRDPDLDEAERRKGMGIPGEWRYVTPQTKTSTLDREPCQVAKATTEEEPVGEGTELSTDSVQNKKRVAAEADDDDMRAFKLRRKVVGTGLGDIFDPQFMPIKLKVKKGELETTEEPDHPPFTSDKASASAESEPITTPKWIKMQWKKVGADDHFSTTEAGAGSGLPKIKTESGSPLLPTFGGTEATNPIESIKADPATELAMSGTSVMTADGMKTEDLPHSVPTGLFRKRKIPARRGA